MIDFKWLEEKVFLRPLAEQEQKTLKDTVVLEYFTKGDIVTLRPEMGGVIYLLKSGRVDAILGFSGESLKLTDLGEGAQLGDMSFLDDAEARASIIVKEDCEVYKITRDALARLFVYHQSVAKDLTFGIMRNMGRTLRHMNLVHADYLQYIQGPKG